MNLELDQNLNLPRNLAAGALTGTLKFAANCSIKVGNTNTRNLGEGTTSISSPGGSVRGVIMNMSPPKPSVFINNNLQVSRDSNLVLAEDHTSPGLVISELGVNVPTLKQGLVIYGNNTNVLNVCQACEHPFASGLSWTYEKDDEKEIDSYGKDKYTLCFQCIFDCVLHQKAKSNWDSRPTVSKCECSSDVSQLKNQIKLLQNQVALLARAFI